MQYKKMRVKEKIQRNMNHNFDYVKMQVYRMLAYDLPSMIINVSIQF